MKGDIRMMGFVSDMANQFQSQLAKCLDSKDYNNLDVEVQYSSATGQYGMVVFSALILGREREDENCSKKSL
jgi:hypothetical protein